MNTEEYKRLINRSDVLDHTTLNVTLKALVSRQEFELANKIQEVLKHNQIEKPTLHSKPHEAYSNYYRVNLNSNEIDKIVDMFGELEAAHVSDKGETTPTASYYASLLDIWNKLA